MTTSCVTLDEIKSWLRVDHEDDDDLLETLGEAATELAETRLRRPIIAEDDVSAIAKTEDSVPKSIKVAVLVITSFMYENRNATDLELRDRVLRQSLLDQWILWGDDDESVD
jgi:uncharacterized phage protein (predicted DNA packaging)|nr:MAG TPA: Head Tail Connector Protein [Caudoviricetes sp.]